MSVKLITAVTQPGTFEAIKEALALFGVRGMTVGEVARTDQRRTHVQVYRGLRYTSDMEPSLRIELLVPNDEVPDLMHVIGKILAISDPAGGVLWNSPVDLVVRVRTNESGPDAI